MNYQLNLSQIKRCDQYWDEMEQKDKGRICGKCEKFLYDFRGMSDLEIAYIHSQSNEPVCGMYDDFRLKDNPNFNKTKFKLNKLYVAGVFGLLLNNVGIDNKIKAQTVQTESKYSPLDTIKYNKNQENQESEFKILRGKILNQENIPISGVVVSVKGSNRTAISDYRGFFELDIKEELSINSNLILVINYINVEKQEIIVNEKNTKELNTFFINANITKEIISTDTGFAPIQYKPWYKKLWESIVGIF